MIEECKQCTFTTFHKYRCKRCKSFAKAIRDYIKENRTRNKNE